jgi:polyisoprenoid-binding protein YceI
MTTGTLSRIGIPPAPGRSTSPIPASGSRSRLWASPPCADAGAYGRVDAASVDTNLARRDKHLRSTDFLSAESHPELTFRSKAIEPIDEDTLRVISDLSINGVANDAELTAELGGIETGPEGEQRSASS